MTLRLPLRIVPLPESIKVEDAAGVAVSYHYFSDDEQRRQQTNRMTREEAVRAAQIMARGMTDWAQKTLEEERKR